MKIKIFELRNIRMDLKLLKLKRLCCLALVVAALNCISSHGYGKPYGITTTTGMVNDIVKNITGDRAELKHLIGEGIDPHLYKPTRSDVVAFLKADVIFYSGLMLEGKMADVLVKVATKGKPVYAVTELIDEKYLLEPSGFSGHYDPHVWMDVSSWMKAVKAALKALVEYDVSGKGYYHKNAENYLQQLQELDDYVKKIIATIPQKSRVLVTAHDAFNYFGRAYQLEVKGIQGISTESEAGLKDINGLVNEIVARGVKAVFVETSVADKNIRALIEGARVKGHDVKIGGKLFSDAMGAPGTYEGSYIGMIDHNATVIVRGLGGRAPELGMHGKLTMRNHH